MIYPIKYTNEIVALMEKLTSKLDGKIKNNEQLSWSLFEKMFNDYSAGMVIDIEQLKSVKFRVQQKFKYRWNYSI